MNSRPVHAAAPFLYSLFVVVLAITQAPNVAALLRLERGYHLLLRAYDALPPRAKFEIGQVGVSAAQPERPASTTALLETSKQVFQEIVASETYSTAALHGWLRASALAGQEPGQEFTALGDKQGLHWYLATSYANSDPARAAGYYVTACENPQRCVLFAQRLVNAGRYGLAIAVLRSLAVQSNVSYVDRALLLQAALDTMPMPGIRHSDIVENCVVFFGSPTSVEPDPAARHPMLADIHALCAEGLIVEPEAAAGREFGSAELHAQAALDLGGPTRYRLAMRGWAALTAGATQHAIELLQQAKQDDQPAYQRVWTEAQLLSLIEQLLSAAETAHGY